MPYCTVTLRPFDHDFLPRRMCACHGNIGSGRWKPYGYGYGTVPWILVCNSAAPNTRYLYYTLYNLSHQTPTVRYALHIWTLVASGPLVAAAGVLRVCLLAALGIGDYRSTRH